MKQLNPKAVWLFFFSYLISFLIAFFVILFIFASGVGLLLRPGLIALASLLLLIVIIAFTYFWAKLSYHYYHYQLTDDCFRKELGVVYKKYVSIPYDRIQNIDINRGIIDRLLGLSTLLIQTAGSSMAIGNRHSYGFGAEGTIPGLSKENAEELRDELIRRAKKSTNQGL